jgi:hypothetical protein
MDRFNQPRTIAGANQIAYKVSGQDTSGGLFIFEQVSLRNGGPPRHLHHGQEDLIGFQPAGRMETFFPEAAKIPDCAADEKLYRACEMEIVGPPLSLI